MPDPQGLVFFLQFPADDDELVDALFQPLELEIETLVAGILDHAGNIERASLGGQHRGTVLAWAPDDSVLLHVTGKVSEFAELSELLEMAGSPLPLAELHGGLCGVICAGGQKAALQWLEGLLEDCSSSDAEVLERLERDLKSLGDRTWAAFQGHALEFAPLLPDDDAGLAPRVEALALWCHGFLAGLVIGGLDLTAGDMLSEEMSELVHDFVHISRAGIGPDEHDDADVADGSLVELVEYARIGAQLAFEELARRPETPERRTIH